MVRFFGVFLFFAFFDICVCHLLFFPNNEISLSVTTATKCTGTDRQTHTHRQTNRQTDKQKTWFFRPAKALSVYPFFVGQTDR